MKGHRAIPSWALYGMLLLAPMSLHAHELHEIDLPWLTGPLIAPTGTALPRGHYSVQPFLSFTANTGTYNSHWHSESMPNFYNLTLEVQAIFGLTKWMDFQITPLGLYNRTEGKSATRFGDLSMGFDFQLISDVKYRWFPGMKLQVIETFPTGHYQKLNPEKLKTDASGLGSFYTSIGLVFYKVYHLYRRHYLSMTLSADYSVFAPTHVKGFNIYGGSADTRGKVYPGNSITAIVSFEFTFNEHWVFAIDNVYVHANKTRFSGNPGSIPLDTPPLAEVTTIPAIVGGPSLEQLSFAPALEYNFSAHFGIIAGSWFSAAGRNSIEFRSGIISCIYSF